MFFLKTKPKNNVAIAPLAEANSIPDTKLIGLESEDELMVIQGQTLVSGTSPIRKDPEEDGGVIIHEVRSGDTVGSIAAQNHVSINTIMWANELDNVDSIMPGDKLFILPVSGLNYTVKKGDNIDSIATKYKAEKEKIMAFNDLPANGELREGQEIIIPDGEKEITAPKPTPTLNIPSRLYESFDTPGKILGGKAGKGHSFPYGYCTWYVAQKRYIPWGGNAGTWLYHAKSAGYATGKTPRVGSIMVSSESWWGHVGIVEKISGNTITISEMNYRGWAKKSSRTLDSRSRLIKGFIY